MIMTAKVELREQALGLLSLLDECRMHLIRVEIIEELLIQSQSGCAVNLPKSKLAYNKIKGIYHV